MFLHLHMISVVSLLVIAFFKKKSIVLTVCSLKYSQNVFMQSLPLYISFLFSMSLNDDIVDIEKPDEYTFVVDDFSGLFLHPLVFSIED